MVHLKNTLTTWVKNKVKILDALEKRTNVKRRKLKTGNNESLGKAIFNWFLSMQSQNVPLPASMTEKAVTFAKILDVENVQASMVG